MARQDGGKNYNVQSYGAGSPPVVDSAHTQVNVNLSTGGGGQDRSLNGDARLLASILETVLRIQSAPANLNHPSTLTQIEIDTLRGLIGQASQNDGELPEEGQTQARSIAHKIRNFLLSAGEQSALAAFMAMIGLA